jgi:hypothetical protein
MDQAAIKAMLETVNRMQADGVITLYAIGGAFGATFYIHPATVPDVEVYVVLPTGTDGAASSLNPIYDYLAKRGNTLQGDLVIIGGCPVKFLPVVSGLEHEALNESVAKELDGVRTWVMAPEQLVGIALRSGRPEDEALALQFLKSDAVDHNKLHLLLHRHGLGREWHQFSAKYLEK